MPSENSEINPEMNLLQMVNEWLQDGDIRGTKINQNNLDRLNMANLIALSLFKNVKKYTFEPPEPQRSFAQTFIFCEDFSIEKIKIKEKELFDELMKLVDTFEVGAISENQIMVSYSINDVWSE